MLIRLKNFCRTSCCFEFSIAEIAIFIPYAVNRLGKSDRYFKHLYKLISINP